MDPNYRQNYWTYFKRISQATLQKNRLQVLKQEDSIWEMVAAVKVVSSHEILYPRKSYRQRDLLMHYKYIKREWWRKDNSEVLVCRRSKNGAIGERESRGKKPLVFQPIKLKFPSVQKKISSENRLTTIKKMENSMNRQFTEKYIWPIN